MFLQKIKQEPFHIIRKKENNFLKDSSLPNQINSNFPLVPFNQTCVLVDE